MEYLISPIDEMFRWIVEQVAHLSALVVIFGVGAYHGMRTETFTVDLAGLLIQIITVEAVPATLAFSFLVALSGLMLSWEVFTDVDNDERIIDGPKVAAVIPVYRDAGVIQESVGTLLDANYENLEIVIVGEPDDTGTMRRAREFAEHPAVSVMVNRYAGSKAGAINDAVERVDAEYFAAFDVDERIDPDFIPRAMYAILEEDEDVFQARRVPRVTGPVEALAYCERLLFHASYKLVEPLGFTYCRSSSSVFTREAFETVGGLDYLLTEDIDFAHKCFRAGLNVRQSRNITNEMEAPHTWRDLWNQRKRWRLGHIEVLIKALTAGYERGGIRGKVSTARIFSSLAASVFLVALSAKVLVLLVLDLQTFFLLPFFAILFTVAPPLYADYRNGHLPNPSPALLLVPLVYPGFGVLTVRCSFEYFMSWNGEWYQVEKAGA